jgi:hypothetical protein
LLPAQDQFHGPVPVTVEAAPVVQSPVVGALLTAAPLVVPHDPFTADVATGAEHLATPSLIHDQVHAPLMSRTNEGFPALHKLAVGFVLVGTPFAEPHFGLEGNAGSACCTSCAQAGVARNERQNATRKIVLIIVASQLSVCFVERRQIVKRFSGFPKSMNEWFQRRRVEEYEIV